MKSNASITQVTQNDLPFMINWFAKHYYGDVTQSREHFADHPNGDGTTFIAMSSTDEDETLAGYITIRWQSQNPYFRENNIPFIHHLEVFDGFKGEGLGHALIEVAEQCIATRANRAGTCVGIFDAYGPAQRLYVQRGYVPDGRGVCQGHIPIRQGETYQIDHDLIIWLIKDL
ncbi:GNAT family N-acetyltransferase [Chloroflexi bacterium TSY]|nr:GNAT family N-acetyltransferase [Chloroflexi bacterium TSY]